MLKQFHYRMSIILNGTHFLFFSNCAKFSMFLLQKNRYAEIGLLSITVMLM